MSHQVGDPNPHAGTPAPGPDGVAAPPADPRPTGPDGAATERRTDIFEPSTAGPAADGDAAVESDPTRVDAGGAGSGPTWSEAPRPAAGNDATRVEAGGPGSDRTRVEGTAADEATRAGDATPVTGNGDEPTDPGLARWSGSAVVPPAQPKRSRWARLRRTQPPPPPAEEPVPEHPPAVDPWAGQDAPWLAGGLPEDAGWTTLPPTAVERPVDLPPTAIDRPGRPRTAPDGPAAFPPTRHDLAPGHPRGLHDPAAGHPQTRQDPAAAHPPTRHDRVPGFPPGAGQPSRPAADRRAAAPPPPPPPRGAGHPPAAPTASARAHGAAAQPGRRPLPPPPPRVPTRKPNRRERRAAAKALAEAQARLSEAQRLADRRPPARPVGPPPPPPRRRRRWGRRFGVFSLVSLLCCCGVPAWFGWPVAQQYPADAVLPLTFKDLSLRDDAAGRRTADALAEEMRPLGGDEAFAGVYTDRRGKRVTVAGVTGLRWRPGTDLEQEVSRLDAEYRLSGVQTYETGEQGAHLRCGVGRDGGAAVAVCGWADHGSLARVLLTRRSLDESAELVNLLRGAVLGRA
ncbi:hypothetical protein [Spirilliplanes yamanashiensis]|uniref:Uncharacterized protein n=1 Tax=Spirilliplanes yamanashiensis TaxID=42233 RepID=A0A8J3YC28_9ACTN|nr:hypothetical protein [Spirilliplanes yamanashiensis]MDP9816458.1 hypothetical protein [Spirilliplanes yamanashiensis]GIJ05986.1 hypothetical protein Sya03_53380 [Spirilliplanes yamanashiensis]